MPQNDQKLLTEPRHEKTFFGVCDHGRLKPVYAVTETRQRLEMPDIETRGIIIPRQRTIKALIRLRGQPVQGPAPSFPSEVISLARQPTQRPAPSSPSEVISVQRSAPSSPSEVISLARQLAQRAAPSSPSEVISLARQPAQRAAPSSPSEVISLARQPAQRAAPSSPSEVISVPDSQFSDQLPLPLVR